MRTLHGSSMDRIRSLSFATVCLAGTFAFGQAAQRRPAETQTQSERVQQPITNNTAAETGMIMQRSGGSLLKAALAAKPDPSQVRISQASFLTVPEQQPKKLKKHDLVTIVIREESDIQSKGENDFQKDAHFLGEANQMV